MINNGLDPQPRRPATNPEPDSIPTYSNSTQNRTEYFYTMISEDSTFKVSDSQPASVVRAKPTIKVRINPKSDSKASDDHDLILQGLARLNLNISNLSELVSKLLKQQHYVEIRERERRW